MILINHCFKCSKKSEGHKFRDKSYCSDCYSKLLYNITALKPFDQNLETFIKDK